MEWRSDMENAPKDGTLHVRGLVVRNSRFRTTRWEVIAGYLDEHGEFVDHDGNSPWRAEDYECWMLLPPVPTTGDDQ